MNSTLISLQPNRYYNSIEKNIISNNTNINKLKEDIHKSSSKQKYNFINKQNVYNMSVIKTTKSSNLGKNFTIIKDYNIKLTPLELSIFLNKNTTTKILLNLTPNDLKNLKSTNKDINSIILQKLSTNYKKNSLNFIKNTNKITKKLHDNLIKKYLRRSI